MDASNASLSRASRPSMSMKSWFRVEGGGMPISLPGDLGMRQGRATAGRHLPRGR